MARDEDDDMDDVPVKKKSSKGGAMESKRVVAGILAILVGGLGVHKFYLGQTTAGIIQLLSSCFFIGGLIGLIEGIIYLTKSDEEFVQIYQIEKKAWF
jgi:TM2 domain-containing membrane protein YozV